MVRLALPPLIFVGSIGCAVAPLNDLDRRTLTNYMVYRKIYQFRVDRSERTAKYSASVLGERDARNLDCDLYESHIQAVDSERAASNAAASALLMSIGAGLIQSSRPQPNHAPARPTYATHCRIIPNPFDDRMACK
jgi:hypothetical protein